MVLLTALVFLVAFAGVVGCAVGALWFGGAAMGASARGRSPWRAWLMAGACGAGLIASAAGGFVGMAAIQVLIPQASGAPEPR